jgi:hypothetical protein
MSHEAATTNLDFLRQHDFHMNHAIASQPGSPVSFGSEFRPACLLEPVFKHHPLWSKVKSVIYQGAVFPLTSIEKADSDTENFFMLEYENHKFASKFEDDFLPMIGNGDLRGFGLVLPLDS